MRNRFWLISFMIVCALFLVACGDSKSEGDSSAEKDVSKLSYSKVDEITSKDGFFHRLFIDDSGKAIMFGKHVDEEELPMLYVDGETKELDPEWFDTHATMTKHGKALGSHYDRDNDEYSYMFYDAFSDEETIYTLDDGRYITLSFRTDYIEDDNGDFEEAIRTVDPANEYSIDIVNLADNSFEEIELTDRLGDYALDDEYYSPHSFYSPYDEKIYMLSNEANTDDDGVAAIHTYNPENDELELIAELDGYFSLADINYPFTSDGENLLLRTDDALLKYNLDSGELETLNEERLYFSNMDGNKYAELDKETGEITITSIDDGDSNVVYAIDDIENKDIDNFEISTNGDTIVYIYRDVEDLDDDMYYLEILHVD